MPAMESGVLSVGKGAVRGSGTIIKYFPVTAGQTFKVEDWVYVTSGALSIAATASNNVGNITLAGRALANAADVLAGTAGIYDDGMWKCPVEVPADDQEFLFQVYHSTVASATISDTELGNGTGLPLRNQAGQWVLDKEADGTNDRFNIVERVSPAADTYPFVWAKPIEANKFGA